MEPSWGKPLLWQRFIVQQQNCAQLVGDQTRREQKRRNVKAKKTTMRKPGWDPAIGMEATQVSPLESQAAS